MDNTVGEDDHGGIHGTKRRGEPDNSDGKGRETGDGKQDDELELSIHNKQGACKECRMAKTKCVPHPTEKNKCRHCFLHNEQCRPHKSMQGYRSDLKRKSRISVVDLTADSEEENSGDVDHNDQEPAQPALPIPVQSSQTNRVKLEDEAEDGDEQNEMEDREHAELPLNNNNSNAHELPTNAAAAQVTQHTQNSQHEVEHHRNGLAAAQRSGTNNEKEDDEPQTTGVDGKGLWRSWKRNFKNSLLALLDLVDNSLDACIPKLGDEHLLHDFIGRVHIFPDMYQNKTTGLCMINNSIKPINPLVEVLKVYNSSKIDSGAGDIGENGVGLKQGCATLSDLSFILSKNGGNDCIELGILAESLQKEEGVYLPAFHFSNAMMNGQSTLETQMYDVFTQPKHRDLAKCISRYGAVHNDDEDDEQASQNHPNDKDLLAGIDRLSRHCDRICYNFYNNPYVFSVILDNVSHKNSKVGSTSAGAGGKGLTPVDRNKDEKENEEQNHRVTELFRELKREIPWTYLHLPENFDFCIEGVPMTFKYWTERLVDLSSFTVKVGRSIPWYKSILDEGEDTDAYELRVFLGFDRVRLSENGSRKECSLYVYSRQAGRLIKYEPDCRHMLGLEASGTKFCSGLTIIVDDAFGNLPLNPTKQDIAFGEKSFGEVHRENLFKWVGGVTHFYYSYHLKKFREQKTQLSKAIMKFKDSPLPSNLASCDNAKLTTFDVTFKKYATNIRIDQNEEVVENVGKDTYFRLSREKPAPLPNSQAGRKRKNVERLVDVEPEAPRAPRPRRSTLKKAAISPPIPPAPVTGKSSSGGGINKKLAHKKSARPPHAAASGRKGGSRSGNKGTQKKKVSSSLENQPEESSDDGNDPYRPSFLDDIFPSADNDEGSDDNESLNNDHGGGGNNEDGIDYKLMYEETMRENNELKEKWEKEKQLREQTEVLSKRIISVLEKRVEKLESSDGTLKC